MPKAVVDPVTRFADMLSAMGTETRLRIMRLLLSADPDGLVVGELQEELGVPASTLSHHLDKLKHHGLVTVQREGTFLRYAADANALRDLLGVLYTECCSHGAVKADAVIQVLTRQVRE